jgi:hypothetical protein
MVYTLFDHVPETPVGKPVAVAPFALAVVYFIAAIAVPEVTVWALLEVVRVIVGRAFTVTAAALVLLAVQPAVDLTYKV